MQELDLRQSTVSCEPNVREIRYRGALRRSLLLDLYRLFHAAEGFLFMAHVGDARPRTLNSSRLDIRAGNFHQQLRGNVGILGQRVEIIDDGLEHGGANLGRLRKICEVVIRLDHDGFNELLHLIGSRLRHARLPYRDDRSGSHGRQNRQYCRDARFVPAEKLPCPIERSIHPRDHGLSVEISRQILGELFGPFVAPLRLRAQRHQNDVVQVAAEFPREAIRKTRSLARLAAVAGNARCSSWLGVSPFVEYG